MGRQSWIGKAELLYATFKEGTVVTNYGEDILKVHPQYCTFSAEDLAPRMKQTGLELACLPWIACRQKS